MMLSAPQRTVHPWLKQLKVAFVPGETSWLMEEVVDGLLEQFGSLGHEVQDSPGGRTDLLLTTARFGEPLPWRKALFFTARKRFQLENNPAVYTLVQVGTREYQAALDHFQAALERERPDPADFEFPGLAPESHRVLLEQSRRGGPILALERQVQAQAKSIRILLIVGDDRPLWAHHFDLVGAHPRIDMVEGNGSYQELVLRMVTVLSTEEVTDHEVVDGLIPRAEWMELEAPKGMLAAGSELGRRGFFTDMVRIADLVAVPAVSEGVAAQYSEGCFATWEPKLGVLIATVTGSARPVDKDAIGEGDLAVIVGVRPDGKGALVRHVAGKRNDPPSSEAVELMEMDSLLPKVMLEAGWKTHVEVPVLRSKLHGHRGVAAYDPARIEHVPLEPAYYHYPVSCATQAQAWAIKDAFGRSAALRGDTDPRQLVFTVLPGHGVVIAEKWLAGKAAFQAIWEAMDTGELEISNRVPQAMLRYVPGPNGRMILQEG